MAYDRLLATGVHSYSAVCHSFSIYLLVLVKPYQTIHNVQIYFVFLSVGNTKTDLKAVTWVGKAEALLLAFGLERWFVRACKCAYDCGQKLNCFYK